MQSEIIIFNTFQTKCPTVTEICVYIYIHICVHIHLDICIYLCLPLSLSLYDRSLTHTALLNLKHMYQLSVLRCLTGTSNSRWTKFNSSLTNLVLFQCSLFNKWHCHPHSCLNKRHMSLLASLSPPHSSQLVNY